MNTGDAQPGEGRNSAESESKLDRAMDELLGTEAQTQPEGKDQAAVKPEGDDTSAGQAPEDKQKESEETEAGEEAKDAETQDLDETGEDKEKLGRRAEKRINKLSAKIHDLEETLETEKAKRQEAEERLNRSSAAMEAGLHPDYVKTEDAELVKQYEQEMKVRGWCRKYRETGYEGSDGKTFTAEEIQDRLDQANDRLIELAPKARTIMDGTRRQAEEDRRLGKQIREARAKKAEKAGTIVRDAKNRIPPPPKPAQPGNEPSKRVNAGIDRAAYEKSGRTAEGLMNSMGDDFFG